MNPISDRSKRKMLVIALSISVTCMLLISGYIWFVSDTYDSYDSFDSEVWRSEKDHCTSSELKRAGMAKTIINNHIALGKHTRADVERLLGNPDYVSKGGNLNYYAYCLGRGPFTFNTEVLNIEFDEEGRVNTAYIKMDIE